jgi:hypothetical protein
MANAALFAAAAIVTLLAGPSPAAGQTLDKLQLHKVRAVHLVSGLPLAAHAHGNTWAL